MASLPFNIFPSSSATAPSASSTSFSITSPWNTPTDIWRKPANPTSAGKEVRTFNSPMIFKKVDIQKFKRVGVTVKANWERLYDQGGLALILSPPNSSITEIHEPSLKWIKAGIEFYNSRPFIGHVACEKWADWSLTQAGITPDGNVTIEMERDAEAGTLWIYAIGEKGDRIPVREVTWVFADEELSAGREVWVGAYACTPILEGRESEKDGLTVRFEGWELDVEA
ncbi:uncharacterized protein LY89DRAFT_646412 [Mollisia scopiformis]|uniref:Uncharacterized protein n=1 Tax=Mollisia scopiformis TaxID=149040 RepID=A0A194XAQ1_MOLSC|nr:uncharacterized protein LY89DRAFT_646412 [Mollisia scopiformis]KUJ17219.1 hypothetical protein LY89DRAFT_646412 [Mollisia scopiformis]